MPSGKTPPPVDLSDEEKVTLFEWCQDEYPQYAVRERIRKLVDTCFDWHRAEGKNRKDWPATCRNWIRKQADIDAANPTQNHTIPEAERLMNEANERKKREIAAQEARRRQEEAEELARDQELPLSNVVNLGNFRK